MKQYLYHLLCGMVMGTADLIPGVSGGTMAWILGIYARLIAAIDVLRGPLLKDVLRGRVWAAVKQVDWALLLPLVGGLVLAIALMVKLVGLPGLVREHPDYVYALFFGLILGSVPLLLRSAARPSLCSCWLLLGGVLGFALTQLVPAALESSPIILFGSGMVAISAMLLPGISGSFILLILGQYAVILDALERADFSVLLPFVFGCVAGLVAFAKLLHFLLARYHAIMVWLMGGLLLGSLPRVWPFQAREYVMIRGKERLVDAQPIWPDAGLNELGIIAGLMLLGLALVFALSRFDAGRR